MFSAIHSSVSGLLAASRSMAAHADTIANMRTSSRVEEALVGMSLDRHQFKANLTVIRTADAMAGALFNKEV